MKTLTVSRYELVTMLRKPGYLVLALGLPLLGLVVLLGYRLIKSDAPANGEAQDQSQELQIEGFVDMAGLFEQLPADLPEGTLIQFADEQGAIAALEADEITAYYLVPADYVSSGELIYVHPTLNPLSMQDQSWIMRRTVLLGLLEGDAQLTDRVWNPLSLEEINLSLQAAGAAGDCPRPGADCSEQPLLRYLPTFVLVFFFVALTNGASMLIRSVGSEKQNRVIEILTASLSPMQLMGGKIIGLGIATLLGFAAWLIAAWVAFRASGVAQTFPPGFSIPGELLPWSVGFFLLGFGLYASLMAGLGALVPNIKETTQAAWLVMGPMLVGYMVGIFAIDAPHSPLMIIMSLLPLTSPLVMVQRLSIGGVPPWQLPASMVLLLLGAVGAIWLAGKLFRAQHLLSGQSFSVGRVWAALTS